MRRGGISLEPGVVTKYDATCDSYDELYGEEQFLKYDFIFNKSGVTLGRDIADVGCGTGLLYEFLKNTFKQSLLRYLCIDPSEGMIRKAVSKNPGDPHIIFLVSYAESLPIKDGSVDDAVMVTVWDNLEDPMEAVNELRRVVRNSVVVTKHSKTASPAPKAFDHRFEYIGVMIDEVYVLRKRYL
jgi:ubiquinone/menaquinone biosynthesis C-methylase UbiE